jgi:aspartate aminotransferase
VVSAPPLGTQAARIAPSGIRAVANAAWTLPDAIHLEFGEPAEDTPAAIVAAADRAARAGRTRYAPSAGLPALREAICTKLARDNGLDAVGVDQVLVSAGGVGGLYAAYRSVLDAGDEILVPDPGWPNLVSLAQAVDAVAVRYPLHPDTGGYPGTDVLDALITSRSRAIVLNTPSNPTGATWSRAEQAALGAWAAERGLWVISDECYDQLWFDEPNTTFAVAAPHTPSITVFSLSKTYAMTGWRVGYAVSDPATVARLTRVVEATASSVNTPTQWAAVQALLGEQDAVAGMRAGYRARRDRAIQVAAELGLPCRRPGGAFYLWLSLPEQVSDTARFALDLLAEQRVALAPGSAFSGDGPPRLRMSLAASEDDIERGLRGLAEFLSRKGYHRG